MYFDPSWIFQEKPPVKTFPNITGLMGDEPKKKPVKVNKIQTMADIFATPDTNSAVFGGNFYSDNGVKYFEPTHKNVKQMGGEQKYQEWFSKEFPKVQLSFPVYQQDPARKGVFEIQ